MIADGDPLSVTAVGARGQRRLGLDQRQRHGWPTPPTTSSSTRQLPDFAGTETFTYTISDGNGEYRHRDRDGNGHQLQRPARWPRTMPFTVAEDSINNVLDREARQRERNAMTDDPDGDLLSVTAVGATRTTAARSRSTTMARVADTTDDFIEYSPAARLRRRPRPSPTRSTDGNGEYRLRYGHRHRHQFQRPARWPRTMASRWPRIQPTTSSTVKLDNGNGDRQ